MARVGSDWSLGFYSGSIIPPVELKKIFLQDTFCEILFSSRNIYKFGAPNSATSARRRESVAIRMNYEPAYSKNSVHFQVNEDREKT